MHCWSYLTALADGFQKIVQRCICVVKLTVSNNRKCPGKRRTYPTSYTGSLFSASHGRWKTLVAAGHVTTQNKYVGWEGWQSVLIVAVVNFVAFKTSSNR